MAPKPKKEVIPAAATSSTSIMDNAEDFSAELIKQLNKEAGDKIAFNLGDNDAPTNVRRWISTGSRLLDYCISNRRNGGLPEGRIIEIQGPAACHAKGTEILMFNGELKKVENILVGDRLMGPDNTPRLVLSLATGFDEMFDITPKRNGSKFTVNQQHVLSLKRGREKNKAHKRVGEIINLTVENYLTKSATFKKQYRLYRASIRSFGNETPRVKMPISPYILGLLIGDGSLSTKRIELTTSDSEISQEYTEFCKKLGYLVSTHLKKGNKAFGLYHRTGNHNISGKTLQISEDRDEIRCALRQLDLLDTKSGSKFVPQIYKCASWADRLELLAGLIDTDGCRNKNGSYEYCSKSNQLAEDFAFIARSLGLVASVSNKVVNGILYHRVYMNGDTTIIPSRLNRKTSRDFYSNKDFSLVGFNVASVGKGEYFGFTVDKDHLYLMADFIVSHNSGKSHCAFEAAKATQQMGGVVVYIDTENATSPDNLKDLGIDVTKNFIFIQSNCTEDVFKYAESVIIKSRSMNKDVPVLIIWDSVAACSPKAELEGDYDSNSMGLQARVLSKGMRKISNVIANQKVVLLLINQQRTKLGVMYGDNCLHPLTAIRVRHKKELGMNNIECIEEELTFHDLGVRLGINDFDTPEFYDIIEEGYEILSFDIPSGKEVWKALEAFVVKEEVKEHYRLNNLKGTSFHRVWLDGEWVSLKDHPQAVLVKEPMQVADCQVAETECYMAEGQINHNTTTPGGMAIPYAASVRLRLMSGKPIKTDNDRVIGINVEVKVIKNKVATPFRSCELSIIFGKGILDDEQIFDTLRIHCSNKGVVKAGGKRLMIEGTGAWKTFSVTDDTSGEVLHEIKFYKHEFREKVLNIPEYQTYIADLLDAAMIMGSNDTNHLSFKGADPNSVEEMKRQESQD